MRRFVSLLSAFVLAAAGLIGFSSPAQAVTCGYYSIQFFNYASDPEPMVCFGSSTPAQRCQAVVPDNRTSYIVERTGYRWHVYVTGNCTGIEGTIWPNSGGPMAGGWDNTIGSAIRTTLTT